MLASAGLLGIVYATVRGNTAGWGAASTLAAYGAGAVLLGAFLWWERRSDHPMVPLRLFRSSAFSTANAANFLLAFAMFSGFLMLIQFFAHAGEGPADDRRPHAVLDRHADGGRAVRRAARPAHPRGPGRGGGPGAVAIGMLAMALLAVPDAGVLALAPAMVAIGVGIGFVIPNVAAAALAAVPAPDIGKASGILSTSRQVGSVAGVSVGFAIYQAAGDVSAVFFAAAAAAAVGAAIAGVRAPALLRVLAPAA